MASALLFGATTPIAKHYLQEAAPLLVAGLLYVGSGLGLATSYSIIKKHDGLIQAESELGSGTTFLVYLPAADRSALAITSANDTA